MTVTCPQLAGVLEYRDGYTQYRSEVRGMGVRYLILAKQLHRKILTVLPYCPSRSAMSCHGVLMISRIVQGSTRQLMDQTMTDMVPHH